MQCPTIERHFKKNLNVMIACLISLKLIKSLNGSYTYNDTLSKFIAKAPFMVNFVVVAQMVTKAHIYYMS